MLVVEQFPEPVTTAELQGKDADLLQLTWEQRRWTRGRYRTLRGRQIALALPTGTVLRSGQILWLAPEWYLTVEAMPENVVAILPRDYREAVRVAFEVGNRHFPLALDGQRLLVPNDSAMTQLLGRLGAAWEPCSAVFDPLGCGHEHGH
jgi:urease accessory protein